MAIYQHLSGPASLHDNSQATDQFTQNQPARPFSPVFIASCLWPADGECVDFLGADVAGEYRGAIGRDTDVSTTHLQGLHHTTKIFQAGDGLDLAVGRRSEV